MGARHSRVDGANMGMRRRNRIPQSAAVIEARREQERSGALRRERRGFHTGSSGTRHLRAL
jgi:hypothetical protein